MAPNISGVERRGVGFGAIAAFSSLLFADHHWGPVWLPRGRRIPSRSGASLAGAAQPIEAGPSSGPAQLGGMHEQARGNRPRSSAAGVALGLADQAGSRGERERP